MTNSIRTPKKGLTANSRRIAEAVDNEDWQKLRLSLKGRSTQNKLYMLEDYWNEGYFHFNLGGVCRWSRNGDCTLVVDEKEWENYQIRIDNYIKALCRGGQLFAGESLETVIAANWEPKIKK